MIEYFCDEGFTLNGDYRYVTCQYGQWDHRMQISCLREQGTVFKTLASTRKVTFSLFKLCFMCVVPLVSCVICHNTSKIGAVSQNFCLFGLVSSGCVRPYMVQNSWVNLTETPRGLFPVGTVLQYSCDPTYLPDGPSILTCTTLGRWSSEPPHCVYRGGELFTHPPLTLYSSCFRQMFQCFLFSPPSACPPLSEPENGGYTCHPSPCEMFPHGILVEFFCNSGFVLRGYNYLTCQFGQWDGPVEISCMSQGWSR